ncbi:MAG: hypothetical protein Ct9H90mP13_03750 [Pseudomonadota bacterium]|nr:MAG: hypothetical protein Ct9H90mP13_03750 [Pseudomonadota bacterium]
MIGGTNGKGTTTSILEQLFHKSGYKTGAFTSPHLTQYNERVRINLNDSSDKDWISAFETIENVRGDIPLTTLNSVHSQHFRSYPIVIVMHGSLKLAWVVDWMQQISLNHPFRY